MIAENKILASAPLSPPGWSNIFSATKRAACTARSSALLGVHHLALAEDVAQEAMLRAPHLAQVGPAQLYLTRMLERSSEVALTDGDSGPLVG